MAVFINALTVIQYCYQYENSKNYFDFLTDGRSISLPDSTKISPEVSAICKYLRAEYMFSLLRLYTLVFSFALIILVSSFFRDRQKLKYALPCTYLFRISIIRFLCNYLLVINGHLGLALFCVTTYYSLLLRILPM